MGTTIQGITNRIRRSWKPGMFVELGWANSPGLMNRDYMSNRHPFFVSFYSQLKKGGSSILEAWKYLPPPEQIKYNTQCCDNPTIKNFMWGNSI